MSLWCFNHKEVNLTSRHNVLTAEKPAHAQDFQQKNNKRSLKSFFNKFLQRACISILIFNLLAPKNVLRCPKNVDKLCML